MHRSATLGLILTALVFMNVTPAAGGVAASTEAAVPSGVTTSPSTTTPASVGTTTQADVQASRAANLRTQDLTALAAAVDSVVAASGASVGLSLVEIGGTDPTAWAMNGSSIFTAASTYKLVALMMEAQSIASGATDPNGLVCFEPDDYEAGWFDDYTPGACYTRNELAWRAGTKSDNTAGHMLVRDLGGADALNAWAASLGATNSAFFVGNTTTPDDLNALWVAEAGGGLGGAAAQAWLYPLLTSTATEAGIPAGMAVEVVHKTGAIDAVENDTALILSGPNGAYVLTVMTDGLGGAEGWQLIAAISAAAWSFESGRPDLSTTIASAR